MNRTRLALVILASLLKLTLLLSPASAGELRQLRRTTRITTLRPIRATGRAQAGYPLLQTTANVTRVAANVTGLLNPLKWFF